MFNAKRFMGAFCSAGYEGDSEAVTAFVNTVADPPFVTAGFGIAYMTNPRSAIGRGRMAIREHEAAAIRVARSLVSTDPGRTASGALKYAVGMSYDAAVEGDALHDARISALRSWEPIAKGVFIQRQRLLSQAGSDYVTWQHAAIMIAACYAAHSAGWLALLDTLRKTTTGTLDPSDAKAIEESVFAKIEATLITPDNVRGTQGHISAAGVTVSLTELLPALSMDIRLRAPEWPDDISITLRYANDVS